MRVGIALSITLQPHLSKPTDPAQQRTGNMPDHPDILIIGGGLAGLACAIDLQAAGKRTNIIEASDGPGGRVRSDLIDGFVCDRGFQVLLEAYPEARRRLDYQRLILGRFRPGAVLYRTDGKRCTVADPWRVPWQALSSLRSPGTIGDKLRVLALNRRLGSLNHDQALAAASGSTRDYLQAAGFSSAIIDGLFAPWFGGILCDRSLQSSAKLFATYYAALVQGCAVLPAGGMGMIPLQLVEQLQPGSITYGLKAARVQPGRVILDDGSTLRAPIVVVATDAINAARLLGHDPPPPGVGVRSLWFAAPQGIDLGPWIALDADGSGPINHVAIPSQVAADYAPPGYEVVVASALGEHRQHPDLVNAARQQLKNWFGAGVDRWRLLADQDIPHAQPRQLDSDLTPPQRPQAVGDGLWLIGDHRSQASINGALNSGGLAALEILNKSSCS